MSVSLQAAIKCADLGHWALPNHLHLEWVDRLQAEFFAQGDRERAAGLPVSPLMDREKASSLSSSQVCSLVLVCMRDPVRSVNCLACMRQCPYLRCRFGI